MRVIGTSISKKNGYNDPPHEAINLYGATDNVYQGKGTQGVAAWGDNSIAFDGNSDFLTVLDNDYLGLTGMGTFALTPPISMSMAMWFKMDSSHNFGFISKGTQGSNDMEFRTFYLNNCIYFDVHTNAVGTYKRVKTEAISYSSEWQHICFTYGCRAPYPSFVYLNGQPLDLENVGGDGAYTGPNNESSNILIGTMANETSYFLNGNVAHIMMWYDRELTHSEVTYISGVHGSEVYYPNPRINTDMYGAAGSLSLYLPCQSVASFDVGDASYSGPLQYGQWLNDSKIFASGADLEGTAALELNNSPSL